MTADLRDPMYIRKILAPTWGSQGIPVVREGSIGWIDMDLMLKIARPSLHLLVGFGAERSFAMRFMILSEGVDLAAHAVVCRHSWLVRPSFQGDHDPEARLIEDAVDCDDPSPATFEPRWAHHETETARRMWSLEAKSALKEGMEVYSVVGGVIVARGRVSLGKTVKVLCGPEPMP